MCRCGGFRSPSQLGIPLNDDTFSKMDEEEQKFWESFLKEAQEVINEEDAKGRATSKKIKKISDIILKPPPSLQSKYQKAIAEYDGEKYCQIQQLKEIFAFKDETLEE